MNRARRVPSPSWGDQDTTGHPPIRTSRRPPMPLRRSPSSCGLSRSIPTLGIAAACSACGAEPEQAEASALRARFPAHAATVLEAGEPLVVTEAGFGLQRAREPGGWARLSVELPRSGRETLVL